MAKSTINENLVRRQALRSLRFQILVRDAFTCQYCGRKAPEAELEIDHIQPRSQGGVSSWANLITSCADCNQGKRDRLLVPQQAEDKRPSASGPPLSSAEFHSIALASGREFIVSQLPEGEMLGRKRHTKGNTFWRIVSDGGSKKRNVSYYCDNCLPGWAQRADSPYRVLAS